MSQMLLDGDQEMYLNLYHNNLLLKVLNLKSQILNVFSDFWTTLVLRNTVVETFVCNLKIQSHHDCFGVLG